MSGAAKKWYKFRLLTVLLFFTALFVALMTRAFHLQIMSGSTYKVMAERQHKKSLPLPPERGLIFDRNGEKLAASLLVDSVFADPSRVTDADATASRLSSVLHLKKKQVAQQIQKSKNFCWIARMVSPAQAARIRALDLDGVYLVQEPKRFYPNKELAGQLIGSVGLDSNGLEGLELKYETYLKGETDRVLWGRDAKGRKLYLADGPAEEKKDVIHNLILTIDSRIQYLVESHLKEAIAKTGARGGMAIVMDPKTGQILAMANEPPFNPNNIQRGDTDLKRNKAITDVFDPGSTFKPFLAAAALEEGIVKETDRFYCENGAYRVANVTIHEANRKKHGTLTFHEVLKYSSNIGSVKISQKLGKQKFHQYIQSFGFGRKTGIDLPGESGGLVRPSENWTTVDAATIAFGQGISVTALQLISAFSAIANQGVLMQPYLVQKVVNQRGDVVQEFTPTAVRRVISPRTAERLTAILTDVVGDEEGTGRKARIQNVGVAGKTGTSQKFDFAAKRYSRERVRTSFMGFFPSGNPRLAILVTIDEPQRFKWGGEAAAPVFKEISQQIIRCYDSGIGEVPTIEKGNINQPVQIRLASLPVAAAAATGEADQEAEDLLPDFRGMPLKNAMKLAQERDIDLKIVGNGWAVSQAPEAGIPVRRNRACTVYFTTGH
ncbi:MAG TPA: penicillin-binding transpeptidase domain-containing protein [Syntrophales bacterium]|nr:penicillin-binding transpeptidase domain-containing protein [Syntrophales bacterium]HRT61098.1 penicillin-binding transpeptidase domain-containing protein [Syntrophales bacterium]